MALLPYGEEAGRTSVHRQSLRELSCRSFKRGAVELNQKGIVPRLPDESRLPLS